MAGNSIAAENRNHVIFPWSKQSTVAPITIEKADGPYFWDETGKRYLDFANQLVCVNAGHQHPKIIAAVQAQLQRLCYAAPSFATDVRGRLGRAIAEITPPGLDKTYFTTSGAEANEYAVKFARMVTGRPKIITRYRSYHGATQGAMALTGDWRRSFNEPAMPGVVHAFAPYCYRCSFGQEPATCARECVSSIEEMLEHENPDFVAAIIVEPIIGAANGLFVPPDDYLPKLRTLCDRHGIMLIVDEVMTGFGRTGAWFCTDHYGVVPDMLVMGKGLTNSVVPMAAVSVSRRIADHLEDHTLWSGSTHSGHALACAAGLASIAVYREEGLIDNARVLGDLLLDELRRMKARHPSVGDVRGKGLFAAIELVADRASRTPLVPPKEPPYGTGGGMSAIKAALADNGLYVYLRPNLLSLAPALTITEAQLREGLEGIDRVLLVADRMLARHVAA